MKFQSIVIIILAILLIITLVSFYFIATQAGNNAAYPPTIPICPDYYYQTSSVNDNVTCKALPGMTDTIKKSSLSSEKQASCINPYFTSDYYTGTNANCLKYTWYTNCNSIPAWEGITYGVNNPCST